MKKHLNWILAASMGVGGMAFMGCEKKETASNTAQPPVSNRDEAARTASVAQPGDQIGRMDLTNIYNSLGNTVENAVKKGEFDDVVGHLDKPDRDRIGNFKDQKFAEYDGLIDKFQADWKGKYNDAFDLDNSKVFENWVKVAKVGETSDYTKVNVMFPAGHGLPELTVPMVKDAMTWKIDVPDDVSGSQLQKSLQDHLTAFDNMKDQWPADKVEAQRALAHHLFMGVMNKPVMSSK